MSTDAKVEEKVLESLDELEKSHAVEYITVRGFKDGEFVRLASLSAGDISEWTEEKEPEQNKTAGLRLLAKSLCNSHGTRYMIEDLKKSVMILRNKPHKEADRLILAVLELNGLSVKSNEEVKKG